jgi:hypothetical protein
MTKAQEDKIDKINFYARFIIGNQIQIMKALSLIATNIDIKDTEKYHEIVKGLENKFKTIKDEGWI